MEKKSIKAQEIFFVRALIPYTAGIVIGWFFGTKSFVISCMITCFGLYIVQLFMQYFYRRCSLYNNKGVTGLVAAAFLCACGMLQIQLHQNHFRKDYFANHVYDWLTVKVIDDPSFKNGTLRCRVSVIKGYTSEGRARFSSGNLMLYILKIDSNQCHGYTYGSQFVIPGDYRAVQGPRNPGEFDYQFWLTTQDIRHQSFLPHHDIQPLPINTGNQLLKFAFDLRSKQIEYYRRILPNPGAAALASTLILGSRADLSPETIDLYSKTGTIHALSVSGMHVGLIYLLLSWPFQFFRKRKNILLTQMMTVLTLIWLYAMITGFSPSVLRSTIMLSTFLIAKTYHKHSNSYNILAFTALCLLIYNPLYLWDVGFQLSFLAVLGLIGLQPKLQYSTSIKSVWIQKIWNLTTISISAQVATLPLSIYYFHQFPVYFIFSNLLIAIPIALLMYLGLVILIVRLDRLASIFDWVIGLTNAGLEWITELPASNITGIWINKAELLMLSFGMLFTCIAFCQQHKKMLFNGMLCLILFAAMTVTRTLIAAHQRRQIHFDLPGHHARAEIKGYGALLYTDLDPNDKPYRYSIQPALELYHIRRLRILPADTLSDKK